MFRVLISGHGCAKSSQIREHHVAQRISDDIGCSKHDRLFGRNHVNTQEVLHALCKVLIILHHASYHCFLVACLTAERVARGSGGASKLESERFRDAHSEVSCRQAINVSLVF